MLLNAVLGGWLAIMAGDAVTTHVGLQLGAQERLLSQNPWVNDGLIAGEAGAMFYLTKKYYKQRPKTAIAVLAVFMLYRGWIDVHNYGVIQQQRQINGRP